MSHTNAEERGESLRGSAKKNSDKNSPSNASKKRRYTLYVCPKCMSDNTYYQGHFHEKRNNPSGCSDCGHEFKKFKKVIVK